MSEILTREECPVCEKHDSGWYVCNTHDATLRGEVEGLESEIDSMLASNERANAAYAALKSRAEAAEKLFEAMRRDVSLMQEACNRLRAENAAARREAWMECLSWIEGYVGGLGINEKTQAEALRRWPEVKP